MEFYSSTKEGKILKYSKRDGRTVIHNNVPDQQSFPTKWQINATVINCIENKTRGESEKGAKQRKGRAHKTGT